MDAVICYFSGKPYVPYSTAVSELHRIRRHVKPEEQRKPGMKPATISLSEK